MAKNSLFGFVTRMTIIVPPDSERPFEMAFHSPSSFYADQYIYEFPRSMLCACQADSDADTRIMFGSTGSMAIP